MRASLNGSKPHSYGELFSFPLFFGAKAELSKINTQPKPKAIKK